MIDPDKNYDGFKAIHDKFLLCPFNRLDNCYKLFFDFDNSICKDARHIYYKDVEEDDRNFLIALGIYDTNKE